MTKILSVFLFAYGCCFWRWRNRGSQGASCPLFWHFLLCFSAKGHMCWSKRPYLFIHLPLFYRPFTLLLCPICPRFVFGLPISCGRFAQLLCLERPWKVFLCSSLIVNISISCCETGRNVSSFPFFSIAPIFGPKETILRALGNQSVKVSIGWPVACRSGFPVG